MRTCFELHCHPECTLISLSWMSFIAEIAIVSSALSVTSCVYSEQSCIWWYSCSWSVPGITLGQGQWHENRDKHLFYQFPSNGLSWKQSCTWACHHCCLKVWMSCVTWHCSPRWWQLLRCDTLMTNSLQCASPMFNVSSTPNQRL